jgi:hypothetical protein
VLPRRHQQGYCHVGGSALYGRTSGCYIAMHFMRLSSLN